MHHHVEVKRVGDSGRPSGRGAGRRRSILLKVAIYRVPERLKPTTQVFLSKALYLWHLMNVDEVGVVSSMGILDG